MRERERGLTSAGTQFTQEVVSQLQRGKLERIRVVAVVTHVCAAVHVDETRVPLVRVEVAGAEIESVRLKNTG